MLIFRNLFFLVLFVLSLNAIMVEDVVFVEDRDSSDVSLKNEFLNPNSEYYTISIGTLTLDRHDPIDYFKTYKLTNAVAYKFGDNKEFARVISGVYKTGSEATENIKNLDPRLQRNKPYSAKIRRHQNLFDEYNGTIIKKEKKVSLAKKTTKKVPLKESKNSIYTEDNVNATKLKNEFLNSSSKYYSIAIGSISLEKNTIENFFKTYDVGDKALAHIYGKNKDKARIIYGLYRTKSEAREALKNLNSKIKANSPFASNMKRFQKFYKKYNTLEQDDRIVELKVNQHQEKEKEYKPNLSDEIKIVKPSAVKKEIKKEEKPKAPKLPKKTEVKKSEIKKIVKKAEKKKVVKKVIKKSKPKIIRKIDPNKNRYIKHSKLEDVYYVEENDDFNILNEVFLNEGSSFYTVDLGELKLKDMTIHEFFIKNSMENNALAYKYGNNKEFARVIYGAYETKDAAKSIAEKLNVSSSDDLKVSNIKNHQKLYKVYHKDKMVYRKQTTTPKIEYKNEVRPSSNSVVKNSDSSYTIVYSKINNDTLLKDEFFNRNTRKYTITLTTFLRDSIDIDKYFSVNGLVENALAFPIGTVNSYYRVIYGIYDSSDEANAALDNLDENLKKNVPYVSRIKTHQKKFESYNGRNLEEEFNQIQKIEFR